MPEQTLLAVRDAGKFAGNTITNSYDEAAQVISQLSSLGIDINDVADRLETEGIDKFIKPWLDLISVVERASAR
jgi:transaldolase